MPELQKARLRLWVQALRSGDYEQGTNVLASTVGQDGFRYCCLGVACEVSIANGLEVEVQVSSGAKAYDLQQLVLPMSVISWYGLESNNPILYDGSTASAFNDIYRWTFEEIATGIEQCYGLGEDDNA